MVHCKCPKCSAKLKIDNSLGASQVTCSSCGHVYTVPLAAPSIGSDREMDLPPNYVTHSIIGYMFLVIGIVLLMVGTLLIIGFGGYSYSDDVKRDLVFSSIGGYCIVSGVCAAIFGAILLVFRDIARNTWWTATLLQQMLKGDGIQMLGNDNERPGDEAPDS